MGPGEREEQGETAGGPVEEIIAVTGPTEPAPRWKHDRGGPRGQPGHETREEPHGLCGVSLTAEPTSGLRSLLCLEEHLMGKEGWK